MLIGEGRLPSPLALRSTGRPSAHRERSHASQSYDDAIALSLAGTAFAQQKTAPQLKQEAETLYSKWEKAVNDYNASGFKDLETADEFTISAFGIETPGMGEKGAERNKRLGVNVKGSVKEVQQIDSLCISRTLRATPPPQGERLS